VSLKRAGRIWLELFVRSRVLRFVKDEVRQDFERVQSRISVKCLMRRSQQILASHAAQRLQRMAEQSVVLMVQDTGYRPCASLPSHDCRAPWLTQAGLGTGESTAVQTVSILIFRVLFFIGGVSFGRNWSLFGSLRVL